MCGHMEEEEGAWQCNQELSLKEGGGRVHTQVPVDRDRRTRKGPCLLPARAYMVDSRSHMHTATFI